MHPSDTPATLAPERLGLHAVEILAQTRRVDGFFEGPMEAAACRVMMTVGIPGIASMTEAETERALELLQSGGSELPDALAGPDYEAAALLALRIRYLGIRARLLFDAAASL